MPICGFLTVITKFLGVSNQKENDFLNKKEYFRTKLYVEPAYLKAERALLKLMIDYEFYDEIVDNLDENNFILDSKRKLKAYNYYSIKIVDYF